MKWKNERRGGEIIGADVKIGPFRLSVHHYIGCGETWFVSCYGVFDKTELLGEISMDEAKVMAVAKLQSKLEEVNSIITETSNIMTEKAMTICPVLFKVSLEMGTDEFTKKYGGFLCPLNKKEYPCGRCEKKYDNWEEAQHCCTEKIQEIEMLNSKIDWTDHSLNFFVGCKKIRPGCRECYMFRDQIRYGNDPTKIRRTNKPTWDSVKRMKPGERVFVCSWSDFFIEEADPWRDDAWEVMRSRPDLIWILLTKRIENVESRLPKDWGDGWPNVIGMVTAENQEWADHDIPILRKLPFKWCGVSIEPMLEPVDLHFPKILTKGVPYPDGFGCWDDDRKDDWLNALARHAYMAQSEILDWVICAPETGPKRRPYEIEWIRDLKNQCVNAGVPFFLKHLFDNNKKISIPLIEGKIWNQFPKIQISQG